MGKNLTDWFKSLVKNPDPPTPAEAKVPAILVIGTAYDTFTEHAVAWMKGVVSQLDLVCPNIVELHDKTLSKGEVRIAMLKTNVPGRVEIFCGHGDYHALLGPPKSTSEDIVLNGESYSVIYDTTMVPRISGSLLAFSCRSGKVLGRAYASYLGKGFIGFDNDLPLAFNPEFMEQLQNIFYAIVIEIINSGKVVPQHKSDLQIFYDQAIQFFLDGEGRHASKSFVYQLFLVEHRRAITMYSTYSHYEA